MRHGVVMPAMPEGDARAGNEGGLPWSADYHVINPAYFDMADLRIDYLVRNGLAPCLVSLWGYWLERLGAENVKRHWRYLVARYGAYPVVWCLCGEVQCIYPDFLPEDTDFDLVRQRLSRDWSDVCRYLGEIDPYRHPLTANLTVEAAALYRTEEDSLIGKNDGVDFDLTIEWFVRQTEVRLTYEYGEFENRFAQNENSSVYLQVKRSF